MIPEILIPSNFRTETSHSRNTDIPVRLSTAGDSESERFDIVTLLQ